LKLAKLDVMAMGAPDTSVADILTHTLPPSLLPLSFKIAKLDVMAMGAPDMSVADIVTNIIKENVLKVGREGGREGGRERV